MDQTHLISNKLCCIYKTMFITYPKSKLHGQIDHDQVQVSSHQKKQLTSTCQQNDNSAIYSVHHSLYIPHEPSYSSQDTKSFYSYNKKNHIRSLYASNQCSFTLTLDHGRENQTVVHYLQKKKRKKRKKTCNRAMNCCMNWRQTNFRNVTDNLIAQVESLYSHIHF